MAGREAPVEDKAWWERRGFIAAVFLAMTAPLLWPTVPPLTDLPAHLGRYKIAIDLANSPSLQTFYDFSWSLLPNLGVDLLVVPLAGLFGVELATKIIVILIPPLTLGGFLWVAREAHGRLHPTYLVAAPLIYGSPFVYGFVNFTLSAALAFIALGLWMRLGRLGRFRLRAAVFVPISLVIWLCHAFGWGMLGLLAFASELARETERGTIWWKAGLRAGLHCLPLAAPLAPMLAWQRQTGPAADWFNLRWKVSALASVLRDRWFLVDALSAGLAMLLVFAALRDKRLDFARSLSIAAAVLLAAFILLPRLMLGGAHNDDRLAPYMLAVALLAVRPSAAASNAFVRGLALAALAFFVLRMGSATASAALYGRSFDSELRAVDHIPHGARVAAFVGVGCKEAWGRSRLEHLPSLAIVRREAFANDQWTVPGSHLLKVRPPWTLHVDPWQMVAPRECEGAVNLETALPTATPGKFDHVWLIQPPPYDPRLTQGWTPVWRDGSSILFRLPPPL
jgi:hypothetical protein